MSMLRHGTLAEDSFGTERCKVRASDVSSVWASEEAKRARRRVGGLYMGDRREEGVTGVSTALSTVGQAEL